MSESSVCDHGYVYGCPTCQAASASSLRQIDSEASGRAPAPQPATPLTDFDWHGFKCPEASFWPLEDVPSFTDEQWKPAYGWANQLLEDLTTCGDQPAPNDIIALAFLRFASVAASAPAEPPAMVPDDCPDWHALPDVNCPKCDGKPPSSLPSPARQE